MTLFVVVVGGFSIEGGHAKEANTSAAKVSISISPSVKTVLPDSQFQVIVVLNIADGWHINAHTPSFDYLIGTKLDLIPLKGVEVVEVGYPSAKKLKFAFAEDALDVYEGRSPIIFAGKV